MSDADLLRLIIMIVGGAIVSAAIGTMTTAAWGCLGCGVTLIVAAILSRLLR